ncbi:MAG: 6-phosphogluconolactonase, partial [Candidatus Eiseniibacteriota bacterium]
DYERELREAFGLDVRFDLVLLGMGADGHTVSLFAGTKALEERDRLVVEHHVPAVGSWRVTMTLPALNGARALMFVVSGRDKAAALARVLAERGDSPLPAARVRPARGELLWFADRAALSQAGEGRGG